MGIRHSFANALTPPNSKLNNEDKELFFKHFYLVDAARVLRNSRFLEELTSDPNLLNSERKEKNSERLVRRLGEVCQYYRIRQLVDMVKR